MRILFIENHDVFAATVRRAFLSEHEVVVVPSVDRAREELDRGTFDVLLVDHDLDDLPGPELVRELRRAGRTIPIVGVSARPEGNDALLEAGATATVGKTEFARIKSVLASALGSRGIR